MDACTTYKMLVVLTACVLLAVMPAVSKPTSDLLRFQSHHGDRHPAAESHDCHRSEEVETLCQRCAKSTKSPMVYPMCCTDEEEVRVWCKRYLGSNKSMPLIV